MSKIKMVLYGGFWISILCILGAFALNCQYIVNSNATSEQPPGTNNDDLENSGSTNGIDGDYPVLADPNLKIELVSEGLESPTQMAFVALDDVLVLEKDNGRVMRIVNGVMQGEPVLDVNVASSYERGMLGIALAEKENEDTAQNVYLYYTESEDGDGNDDCSRPSSCSDENLPLGNRLYRYELADNRLVNPSLLLDLPVTPGAAHNGGPLIIGPDNHLYIPVGEVSFRKGQISNHDDGPSPDGRGGILKITQQGEAVDDDDGDGILGDEDPLDKYYAYGIRNSFGIDFDPVTGNLWDTENGPGFGDEINLVEPGFNSGWERVQGIWEREDYYGGPVVQGEPDDLVDFDGRGEYSIPEFIWNQPVGVTAIKFLDSDKLGVDYEFDIVVGDINHGNLYHFDLNEDRDQLILEGALEDGIADNQGELEDVILGQGFNAITDIEVGPGGNLYILSYDGKLFRVSDNSVELNIMDKKDDFV